MRTNRSMTFSIENKSLLLRASLKYLITTISSLLVRIISRKGFARIDFARRVEYEYHFIGYEYDKNHKLLSIPTMISE